MLKSEIVKTFDERKNAFTPYGFTCELWAPKPMDKLDRHNEIELNYLPEGTLTYFLRKARLRFQPENCWLPGLALRK